MSHKLIKRRRSLIVTVAVVVFSLLTLTTLVLSGLGKQRSIDAQSHPSGPVSVGHKADEASSGAEPDQGQASPIETSVNSDQQIVFNVKNAMIRDPEIVYNTDRIGTQVKACRVKADITVSSAGMITYFWDTYHPQYFNPSNKGPQETVVFDQAGTKTVALETYVSNDDRKFTLVIISPNQLSTPTTTQVWCPSS